jgi:predicted dehydrogenase
MIQVGLVGVGSEWERYRPALSLLRQPIHVEAVYDPVFARAEHVARELEADPLSGIMALASRGNVEAILVMDPGWTRTSVLPLLARYEKPVFFAPSILNGADSHKQLTSLQRDSDLLIVPAMWRRFLSAAIRVQELIATELGRPLEIVVDLTLPADSSTTISEDRDPAGSSQSVTLESLVGWLDFCRNLFRAFPVSASVSVARAVAATPRPEDASPDTFDGGEQIFELLVVYPLSTDSRAAAAATSTAIPTRRGERTARLAISRGHGTGSTITPGEFFQEMRVAAAEHAQDRDTMRARDRRTDVRNTTELAARCGGACL